jgi:hypothetical protein
MLSVAQLSMTAFLLIEKYCHPETTSKTRFAT